jgi:hypothetical protein
MPSRTGFQVVKPREVAIAGEPNAKNRAVFLTKILECKRIGFGNNLFPNFTTQSWIPGKTKNHVKSARHSLGVSSMDGRTKAVQHAVHQIKIGRMKKTRFEMPIKENPNTETQVPI